MNLNSQEIFSSLSKTNNNNNEFNINNNNIINNNNNKKTLTPEKKLKLILKLLEKSEQILSIINLPESAITKYNQLKEITFNKCSLLYSPLTKQIHQSSSNNSSNTSVSTLRNFKYNFSNISLISNLNSLNNNNILFDEIKSLNYKKNVLIEILFELLDKKNIENNALINNLNNIQTILNNINNNNNNFENNEFDIKIEEMKLNEFIKKCDYSIKNFTINNNNNNKENNIENIINSYNTKISELKNYYQNEINELNQKFLLFKQQYNQDFYEEYNKIKNLFFEFNNILSPVYEKYSKKKISNYDDDNNLIENDNSPNKEITKLNFLNCFIEQLFNDNKHLIESIKNIEKEKEKFIIDLNLPFVINAIKKNDVLKEIFNILQIENNNNNNNNNNIINNNIDELIKCIEKSLNQN